MGQQYNKVEKRRRRTQYLERKKAKLKEAAGSKVKGVKKLSRKKVQA